MATGALDAWMALYAACSVLALLTALAAVGRVVVENMAARPHPADAGWRAQLRFAATLWLRWQLAYFSATPVILLILLLFANEIGFSLLFSV